MISKPLLLGALTCLTLANSAIAADLPVRAPPPYAPPLFTWTGFYVGVHAGATFTQGRRITELAPVTANDTVYNVTGGFAALGNKTSFIGGGQVGYNYQINQFVVGLEADASYWGYRASTPELTVAGLPIGGIDNDTIGSKRAHWLATARARLGFAFDRLLVYATGGFAFSDLKYSFVDARLLPPAGPGLINGSVRPNWGWAIGGGLEYAVTNNWTVKGEYLYTHFDAKTFRATISAPIGFVGRTTRIHGDATDLHVVRIGINYKF